MLEACKTETSLSKQLHGSPGQFPFQEGGSLWKSSMNATILHSITQRFSKCGSQTSSINTEWKHPRNVHPLALPELAALGVRCRDLTVVEQALQVPLIHAQA